MIKYKYDEIILDNFDVAIINIERAMIRDSKIYFFSLDTKIQNFQFDMYYKQLTDVLEIYLKMSNYLQLNLDSLLLEKYQVRMKSLLIITNNLLNNINIYEEDQDGICSY